MEEEIFIPIVLFVSIAFILYSYLRYRYLERQAILEKGMSIEELKEIFKSTAKSKNESGANMAKWGIILIAIGLAILIGSYFSDEVMGALIFILPGAGLLLYYKLFATKAIKHIE
ncbi:MAG: hypothetical protein JW956_04065 [Calditrichaceae bacterium]|nr:hypothetical protein [Calditrichaceae bacterium]